MNEIYWITRLDAIDIVLCATSIITLIISIAFTMVGIICKNLSHSNSYDYGDNKEYNAEWSKIGFKTSITSVILCFLFTLATVLTPDTKEATIIYGVGGTFDYLKQNDTAKQLPDKALKAVDSWIEYVTADGQKSEVNEKKATINENDSIKL